MPPKIKKENAKEPTTADENVTPRNEEKSLVENELVVQCVKSRLGRYQESEERLFIDNFKLEKKLERQTNDFADIQSFLKRQVEKQSLQIAQLEQTNSELEQRLNNALKKHEAIETSLREENDTLKLDLQRKTQEFNKKMRGTQEYLDQREQLVEEQATLKRLMEEQLEQKDKTIAEMERSHIQDRDDWKRKTAQKIKDIQTQMLSLTDNQLELTTKRTIMENEQMASELGYQSRQTEKMIRKNDHLLERSNEMKIQLELAEQTQVELTKKSLSLQEDIKRLMDELSDEAASRMEERDQMRSLSEQIKQERRNRSVLERQTEEQNKALVAMTAELETLQRRLSDEEQAKNSAWHFWQRCIEISSGISEVANFGQDNVRRSPPKTTNESGSSTDTLDEGMEHVLQLLNDCVLVCNGKKQQQSDITKPRRVANHSKIQKAKTQRQLGHLLSVNYEMADTRGRKHNCYRMRFADSSTLSHNAKAVDSPKAGQRTDLCELEILLEGV